MNGECELIMLSGVSVYRFLSGRAGLNAQLGRVSLRKVGIKAEITLT